VTVPVEEEPPSTDVGDRDTLTRPTGLIVSEAVGAALPCVAVIVAFTMLETELVLIEKVTVVAPANTVTLDCTVALELLEAKLIPTPPVAAGPDNVTVPVAFCPPINDVGETETLRRAGALTVKVAVFDTPPYVLVIVADDILCTAIVLTVNVPVDEPAATVTEAGTVTFDQLDDKLTVTPPVGAGPARVTVPVDEEPPRTAVGDRARLTKVSGLIDKVAVCEAAPLVAVIVADVDVVTLVVLTVNVAVVAPAATTTVAGTVAFELLDERLTVVPLGPACPLNVTVPVDVLPPITDVGERARPDSPAGLTVKGAVSVVPFKVAEIVAVTVLATPLVFTVKVTVVWPLNTVAEFGTVALALFDDSETTVPPVGAGPFRVIVPVDEAPPMTVVGDRATPVIPAGFTVKVVV